MGLLCGPGAVAFQRAEGSGGAMKHRILSPCGQLHILAEAIDGDTNPVFHDEGQVVVVFRVDGHLHKHVEGVAFIQLQPAHTGPGNAIHIDAERTVAGILQGDVFEPDSPGTVVDDAERFTRAAYGTEHRVKQHRVLAE